MNLLGLFSWAGLSGHTSLPTSAGHWRLVPSLDTASSRGKHINKRYVRNSLAGVLAVFVLVLLHRKMRSESKLPPLYEKYIDYEREMPQHSLSLPYPEGKHAKFLWFANHGSCVYRFDALEFLLTALQGQAGETTCRKWC